MTEHSESDRGNVPGFDDELFQPTLQTGRARHRRRRDRPWRVENQLWIAFFGGALALIPIAYINSRRLDVSLTRQRQVLAVGCAAFLLIVGAAMAAGQLGLDDTWQPGSTGFTIISRAIALIAYLVIERLLRSANRVYQFGGGTYGSLWTPGLLAILVLGLLQSLIIRMVAG